jgi:hypothetical protein
MISARVTFTDSTTHIRSESESVLSEVFDAVTKGFPFYGHALLVVSCFIVFLILLVVWNLTGKGRGSHAGREEVRRQYRRSLAREMAKQDAEAIREGKKRRRWWYQW